MKKLITIAAALFASASLFAFDLDLKLGARLSDDLNFFDFKSGDAEDLVKDYCGAHDFHSGIPEDEIKAVGIDATKLMMGFGANVYANIGLPFLKGLGVQPEVGFHYHNVGFEPEHGSDWEFNYMTLDIPVMVTYKLDITDMFFIQPELGPRFSFTLGKFKTDKDEKIGPSDFRIKAFDSEFDLSSPFNIGIEAGVTFGINVGPGSIVINARYVRDFTKTKVETNALYDLNDEGKPVYKSHDFDIGSTQSVNISVGYQIRIL